MLRKYFLSKLLFPLIKGNTSPQLKTIFGKLNFWQNIDRRGPYKNSENLNYLKFFCQNYLFRSLKKVFLHHLRQFSENWIFEGISTGADLTKMVKICIISICAKKIFFGKIICSTHQRKCFSTMLHNFWKIEFLKEYRQARTLQKWWKFVLSQFVLRNFFLAKLFVPLIKESVSPQCYAIFGKLNFWRNIDRRGPYKNGENWIISICAKKIFFSKIICSTHQRKSFSTFYTIFGKLNFWRNIDRRGPYKNGEICIILICAKKIFFGKIIYSTHQKKCFSIMLRNFWKIEFLKEYRRARTLQKWWKFVLSQLVLRKYFLTKLFVPLIKRSVSPQF